MMTAIQIIAAEILTQSAIIILLGSLSFFGFVVKSVVEDSSLSDDVSNGAVTVKVEGDAVCCEEMDDCEEDGDEEERKNRCDPECGLMVVNLVLRSVLSSPILTHVGIQLK